MGPEDEEGQSSSGASYKSLGIDAAKFQRIQGTHNNGLRFRESIEDQSSQRIFQSLRRIFIGRLFKFNHILLDNQPVNSLLFKILLVVEFVQMLFYVFYRFAIVDEFQYTNASQQISIQMTSSNASQPVSNMSLINSTGGGAASSQVTAAANSFTIYQYFTFLNFHLYSLEEHSVSGFLTVYLALNLTFYLMLIVLYWCLGGGRLYLEAKNDEIKDFSKHFIRLLSLLMVLFMSVLEIPMMTVNVQGYLCEEDPLEMYSLANLQCGSFSHQALIILCTMTLFLYCMFLFVQNMLFTSCNFETTVPWASINILHRHARVVWKLVISFGFALDKAGDYKFFLAFLCAAVGIFISYYKITTASLFNRRVYYVSAFCSMLSTWLFLCIPIQHLAQGAPSIACLFVLVTVGILSTALCIYYQEIKNERDGLDYVEWSKESIACVTSPGQAHKIIYQVTCLLHGDTPSLDGQQRGRFNSEADYIKRLGFFASHVEDCDVKYCSCYEIYNEVQKRIEMAYFNELENQDFIRRQILFNELPKELQQQRKYKNQGSAITQDINTEPQTARSRINEQLTSLDQEKVVAAAAALALADQIPSSNDEAAAVATNPQIYQAAEAMQKLKKNFKIDILTSNQNFQSAMEAQLSTIIGGASGPESNPERGFSIEEEAAPQIKANQIIQKSHSNRPGQLDLKLITNIGSQQQQQQLDSPSKRITTLKNQLSIAGMSESMDIHGSIEPQAAPVTMTADEVQKRRRSQYVQYLLKKGANAQNLQQQQQIKQQYENSPSQRFTPNNGNPHGSIATRASTRRMISQNFSQQDNAGGLPLSDLVQNSARTGNVKFDESITRMMDSAINHLGNNAIIGGALSQQQPLHAADKDSLHTDDEGLITIPSKNELRQDELKMQSMILSLYLEKSIQKFPQSVDLRIQSSYFQDVSMKNEFKAMFELMKCETLKPTFRNRFFIFRRRIYLEKILKHNSETNIKLGERVDPQLVYKTEKLHQRYTRLEYQTANAALGFWRELLSRQINPMVLKKKGCEILKNSEAINELVTDIIKIQPDCVSFLSRYSVFLKQVVNNEHEAANKLEAAQNALMRVTENKKQGKNFNDEQRTENHLTEKQLFGLNTASAIVIMSLQADSHGKILHTNDEITRVLGFERKALVGKNVNVIQPEPIAGYHDIVLKRFLNTKTRSLINHVRQIFAKTEAGYMIPITILIKLYPKMTDQIIIVGFIQSLQKVEGLDLQSFNTASQASTIQPKLSAKKSKLGHHYILTDSTGNIKSVSEGLAKECGIMAKLFCNTDSYAQAININQIFDPMFQEIQSKYQMLTPEGLDVQLDSRQLAKEANLDQLTASEAAEMMEKQGQFIVNVVIKRLDLDKEFQGIDLYRIVILPQKVSKQAIHGTLTDRIVHAAMRKNSVLNGKIGGDLNSQLDDSSDMDIDDDGDLGGGGQLKRSAHSMAFLQMSHGGPLSNTGSDMSMSSTGSNSSIGGEVGSIFRKALQEFKNEIGKKKTPKNIILMSRLLSLVVILTITISAIDYYIKQEYLTNQSEVNLILCHNQQRNTNFISLIILVRSLVNLANGWEFASYSQSSTNSSSDPQLMNSLSRIDRFHLLQYLIEGKYSWTHHAHDFISQHRGGYESEKQQQFEMQTDSLYRLTQSKDVTTMLLPFKFAFSTYLNDVLSLLNMTSPSDLYLHPALLLASPIVDKTQLSKGNLSVWQKDLYFMLTNQMRTLRISNDETYNFLEDLSHEVTATHDANTFTITLAVGLCVSSLSFVLITYQLNRIRKNKQNVMTIFALISVEEVKKAFDLCDQYLDQFEKIDGTLYKYQYKLIESRHRQRNSSENIHQDPLEQSSPQRNKKIASSSKHGGPTQAQLTNEQLMNLSYHNGDSSFIADAPITYKHPQFYNQGIHTMDYLGRLLGRAYRALNSIEGEVQVEAIQKFKPESSAICEENNEKIAIEDFAEETKQEEHQKQTYSKNLSKLQPNSNNSLDNKHHAILSAQNRRIKFASMAKNATHIKKKLKKRFNIKDQLQDTKAKLHLKKALNDQDEDDDDGEEDEERKEEDEEEEGGDEKGDQDVEPYDSQKQKKFGAFQRKEKQKRQGKGKKIAIGVAERQDSSGRELIEQRKKMMKQPSKEDRKAFFKLMLANACAMIIFYAYFSYTYLTHKASVDDFLQLQETSPHFLNRYTDLYLSFALVREKILNNKTQYSILDLQAPQYIKGEIGSLELDEYYHQKAIETESQIQKLKIDFPQSMHLIMDFQSKVDSDKFCESFFPVPSFELSSVNTRQKLNLNTYQEKLNTVVASCNAAFEGNMKELQILHSKGVNLNEGDYDRRSPLHFASSAGQYQAVKYLLENGANPSAKDRWGGTPLNDAESYPEIKNLLLSYNATSGRQFPPYKPNKQTITNDQYRLFYAASFGDIQMMEFLRQEGWNVKAIDHDGRSALSIAASEGHLKAVQYLISFNADMTHKDMRGYDALDDAVRENRYDVQRFLSEQVLVNNLCSTFEDGLLRQGVHQSFGVFFKKLADLQISIAHAQDRDSLMSLLTNNKTNRPLETTTDRTLEVFFITHEFYLSKAVEQLLDAIEATYEDLTETFLFANEVLFFCFLAFQIFVIFYLRQLLINRMKDEVLQSRGLLSLVPESFFKSNQEEISNVIKIMQS